MSAEVEIAVEPLAVLMVVVLDHTLMVVVELLI
jgi:hypothetical protein